jgi:hypothetical protein
MTRTRRLPVLTVLFAVSLCLVPCAGMFNGMLCRVLQKMDAPCLRNEPTRNNTAHSRGTFLAGYKQGKTDQEQPNSLIEDLKRALPLLDQKQLEILRHAAIQAGGHHVTQNFIKANGRRAAVNERFD